MEHIYNYLQMKAICFLFVINKPLLSSTLVWEHHFSLMLVEAWRRCSYLIDIRRHLVYAEGERHKVRGTAVGGDVDNQSQQCGVFVCQVQMKCRAAQWKSLSKIAWFILLGCQRWVVCSANTVLGNALKCTHFHLQNSIISNRSHSLTVQMCKMTRSM